jgi:hypothetical protein
VTPVKKLFSSKTQELLLFVHVPQDLIQLQTMTVLTVFQIAKPAQMQHPVTLANQRPLRQWLEFYQIVTAQLITLVNPILTVCLFVYHNVRPVPTWCLVTLVKKLFLNKTLELLLFVLVLQDLTQLPTMTVQSVFQIVKLAQMQHPVTLVNLQSHRISPEFYLFVTVLQVPIPLPILIALIVWKIVPLALTEQNAPPVKI